MGGQAAGTAGGVRFAGVARRYGDVVALDALDLEVGPGELLVLVGPSGSGKSTALRILAGLEPLDAGHVEISGRDVSREPPHRRDVAMVFQDYALYPHLTAGENLSFGLRVRKVPHAEATRRVADAAERLELGDLLDRYPDQLSGGQRQRVALARAMVREPAVYLLDEPLSNLDAQLRHAARAGIAALHRRLGTTTLHVTHDQAEAMTLGDRVAVLRGGRLQQLGTPRELYERPATRFVAGFFGSPPMNLVDGGGVLGGAAGTVVGVRPEDLRVTVDGGIGVVVVAVEALGSETVLLTETADGTALAVRSGPRDPARPGDRLRLAADPGALHRFDAATGRRR